jgi:hypothetical protein
LQAGERCLQYHYKYADNIYTLFKRPTTQRDAKKGCLPIPGEVKEFGSAALVAEKIYFDLF